MGIRQFSLALAMGSLALLTSTGCNATGLREPSTPTSISAHASATDVAHKPPSNASPVERNAPTPRLVPTTEPVATERLRESSTALPAPLGESATAIATPTLLPGAERSAIFEDVWRTVDENYLYKDFHGADWQVLHNKYMPVALSAPTSDAFYQTIADMVSQLKDDHSRYLSPQDAREEDALQSGNTNYVGIGIIPTPETTSLMIVFVFPGSPADKAGLVRRDRITAIDGIPLADAKTEVNRIRGPKGSVVTLTVRSPEQQPRDITIVRDTITSSIKPSASRLAANPSIGLLVVSDLWTDDMGTLVDDELRNMVDDPRPLKGLILDLRGDGGGFRTVLEGVLGNFVTGNAGTFFNQKGQSPFIIKKGALFDSLQNIPLVVLIDRGSASYAELLAAVLQAKGRAKVVGAISAGNTETIYRYDFPDGSLLWLAEESFRLPDGTNLEGRGVIPNFPVTQDWTAYSDSDDPDMLQAVQVLQALQLPAK